MDKGVYRVVLTGQVVSGFSREAVIAALARLFETSAGKLVRGFEGGEQAIDDLLDADGAFALQQRLETIGARARVDRINGEADAHARSGLHLPRTHELADAGLMHCPACGHEQLVATRCDACGVVFAEYNRRQEKQPQPGGSGGAHASVSGDDDLQDIHAAASARWRDQWLDEDDAVPTEDYHIGLFMGGAPSAYLSEACGKLKRGPRTRIKLSWLGSAVISPFLWAMYRKMWAWGLLIFATEVLLPVLLIFLGAQRGISDKLIYLGLGLMVLSRVVWPALLKSLYCRHARQAIAYLHRMAPTLAPDIDIAAAGGTSRTSVFVGVVAAIVVTLLAWSIIDGLHAQFRRAGVDFGPAPVMPPPTTQTSPAPVSAQDELLDKENKWVATRNRLRTLGQRLNTWLADRGPTLDPTALNIPQIARALSLDPAMTQDGWGRDIRYRSDGTGYQLISAGPDGEFGNADDVEYRRILDR